MATKYINWADVVARYPGLSQVGGAEEVGSSYIGYAENQVEGMLASAYTVPFSDNNLTVKDLCIDLVYIRAGTIKAEARKELRDEFMERIERLLTGKENMVTVDGTVMYSDGGTPWSSTENYHPVFGMGDHKDFVVDSDQVDDEYWARQ